jgi:hypothetical protein
MNRGMLDRLVEPAAAKIEILLDVDIRPFHIHVIRCGHRLLEKVWNRGDDQSSGRTSWNLE